MTTEPNEEVPANGDVNHKRVARAITSEAVGGSAPAPPDRAPGDEPEDIGDVHLNSLTTGGKGYLETMIDCCSRRLVGWAITDHMRTGDRGRAKERRRNLRQPARAGVPTPTTAPSVYTSKDYAKERGVTHSMGAIGTSSRQRAHGILQRGPQTRKSSQAQQPPPTTPNATEQ